MGLVAGILRVREGRSRSVDSVARIYTERMWPLDWWPIWGLRGKAWEMK